MKTVIISPYSQRMRNGERNPKNFPYWNEVVSKLKQNGIRVLQVGVADEDSIGADEVFTNLPLKKLEEMAKKIDCWASVDNFFPHMCNAINAPSGVVVFGKSSPDIFGYPNNTNLLKDRGNLRAAQFDIWEHEKYDEKVWVNADIVTQAILKRLKD